MQTTFSTRRLKQLFSIFILLACLLSGIFTIQTKVWSLSQNEESVVHHQLVAHAGGAVYGFRYTNSLEAVEESYRNGFRFIELDFEWTLDGHPVIIHDWGPMVKRLFMTQPKVFSLKEFKNHKTFQDLTLFDMDMLSEWLKKHRDVHIITDVKKDNIKLLALIKEKYSVIQKQIIPQIYSPEEFDEVKSLGYDNIILTLYNLNMDDNEIIRFATENSLFAVTINKERGFSTFPSLLKEKGIRTYVHTINTLDIVEKLKENGVFGFYTDYFEPNHWIE